MDTLRNPSRAARPSLQPIQSDSAMIPLIPKDMLLTTVETVCYFCTAVGVLLTFMLSPRR